MEQEQAEFILSSVVQVLPEPFLLMLRPLSLLPTLSFPLHVCSVLAGFLYSAHSSRVTLREARAGTEAEAVEERGLLSCSSWLSQPAFLYAQEHLARKHHPSEVGPPTLVVNEENTWQTFLQANICEGTFLIENPLHG